MRAFRLIALAAQAEGLLLRRQGKLMGRKAVLAVAAASFGVAALILLHIAGFIWLEALEGPLAAALWLALVDALIAGLLMFLARPQRDPVADEARLVREQSLSMLMGKGAETRSHDWERLGLQALGVVLERWLKK